MPSTLFRHARVFDGWDGTLLVDHDVLVEDGAIAEVAPHGLPTAGAELVECAGRVLMPGMIDAHTHIYVPTLDLQRLRTMPAT